MQDMPPVQMWHGYVHGKVQPTTFCQSSFFIQSRKANTNTEGPPTRGFHLEFYTFSTEYISCILIPHQKGKYA